MLPGEGQILEIEERYRARLRAALDDTQLRAAVEALQKAISELANVVTHTRLSWPDVSLVMADNRKMQQFIDNMHDHHRRMIDSKFGPGEYDRRQEKAQESQRQFHELVMGQPSSVTSDIPPKGDKKRKEAQWLKETKGRRRFGG